MEQGKIIHPRNYLYEFLVILMLLLLVGIWWILLGSLRKGFIAGGLCYMVLAWSLRLLFQKHHRQGIQHLRAGNYPEAADAFVKSAAFFEKHPAIDKYRWITMFSSNAIPFRQMALNNLGICYLHMGDDAKALEVFQELQRLNKDYPRISETVETIRAHLQETP